MAVLAAIIAACAAAVIVGSARLATSAFQISPQLRQIPPASWPDDALTIAWLGHATLLMNYLGVRVISDPTFYRHVGLAVDDLFTLGPKRQVPAPLAPDQIGPVDLVLITHAHMDHLDLPSLRALPKTAVVIACPGCAGLIAPLGFGDVRPLRWGQQTEVHGLTITAMGARHWGRRWPWSEDLGYNSYVLDKNGVRMLLACDSALTDLFASLHANPPLVAAFSIGAYDPWIRYHADPEQVWRMFKDSGARYLIPIHWGTFRLSKEPMHEPIQRLERAAGADAGQIVIRQVGGLFQVGAAQVALTHAHHPTGLLPSR